MFPSNDTLIGVVDCGGVCKTNHTLRASIHAWFDEQKRAYPDIEMRTPFSEESESDWRMLNEDSTWMLIEIKWDNTYDLSHVLDAPLVHDWSGFPVEMY